MAGNWAGLDDVVRRITDMTVKADAAARTSVTLGAAVVEAAAKRNFSGSHAKGQPHTGGPLPNVVTGTLRRSIHTDPVSRHGIGSYETRVGPTTVYGRRVELGYGGGSGLGRQATKAYPYFSPAVKASRARLESISLTAWRTVPR